MVSSKCFKAVLTAAITASVSPIAFAEEPRWDYDASIYAIYDSQSFEGTLFTDDDIEYTSVDYLRRVKASGSVSYDKFTFDIALDYHDQDNETQVDEFALSYKMNDHIEFIIGKFKEPLGLENQLSLRYQPLLERSVPTGTMLFGRKSGIAFDIEHKDWTLDLAMTYHPADTPAHRDSLAHIARFTFAPLQKKKKFVHVGLDFSSRQGTEDVYDINEPIIAAGVGNLIHSPDFFAKVIKLTGFEFAARYKPVLFQTEYFEQRIKQDALADQTIHGYYATLAWTIFGDSRTYENGKLKFPGDAKHTLELATRVSSTSLTPIFRGDDADVTSVALNYFFKKHVRVSLEYQEADVISNARVNTKTLEGQSVNARLQLAY